MDKSSSNVDGTKPRRGVKSVSPCDWASLLAALLTLYAVVATLYYALLKASLEIRSDGYIELPNQFFGPYSKNERVVTDLFFQDVRKGPGNPTEGTAGARTFNLKDGCTVKGNLWECGQLDGAAVPEWAIFPWVQKYGAQEACREKRYTSLIYNEEKLEYGTADGKLADGVCITYVPKGSRLPIVKGDSR